MEANAKSPEDLLACARNGDHDSLSVLLDVYRNYLRLLARTQIDMRMRIKIDPSDLVQETLLEAYQGFAEFRGRTTNEMLSWLRQILVRNLTDNFKSNRTQKRDINREQSLDVAMEQSSQDLASALCTPSSSPSQRVSREEQAVQLADALAKLPKDYREIILLRQIECLSFDEVAERMNRKNGAVRMLFSRALDRLRHEMGALQ